MNALDMLIGAKVKWTKDAIKTLATVQPRHLGRVAQFDFYANNDPEDYESAKITGILEAVRSGRGSDITVSGEIYDWDMVSNLVIWRSELG